ncbi:MAG TPA: tyrosine-type recombinase/integrase, partial [Bryobacteraceae bacterium]|nr:tyrosine-type recombinase/integrase [Bryobacteraceae bacterium]
MDLFDRFLQERTYLKGVSPQTLRFYRGVGRAFSPILAEPTKDGMMECIQKLLADGVSPTSVNTYLRGLKAYARWLHSEGYLKTALAVQFLKTERKILASQEQVRRLVNYKPNGRNLTRAHMATLVMLDCGLRASECLGLTSPDLDFDSLVIRVKGKGNKYRLVPMSIELRNALFRYCAKHPAQFIFATERGTRVTNRNFQRDLKGMCERLGMTGVRCSPHTLRHTFAVSYLRHGGNLYYLSRILGHTSVKTTERYLGSLGVEDLRAVHDRLSLLGTA